MMMSLTDVLHILHSHLLATLVIGITLYILYICTSLCYSFQRTRNHFQGFPEPLKEKHWLLGHSQLYSGPDGEQKRLKYYKNFVKTFFPRFHIQWLEPWRPTLILTHPDTMKVILKGADPKPVGLAGGYEFFRPWLGDGLLLSGGKKWARSRKLITPAFHFDILKPYIKVYNQCAELLAYIYSEIKLWQSPSNLARVLLDYSLFHILEPVRKMVPKMMKRNISEYADSSRSFEAFSIVSLCTFDVILRCAFSYETDCQASSEKNHPYINAVNDVMLAAGYRFRNFWLYVDTLFYMTQKGKEFRKNCDYLHNVSDTVIESRREALKKEDISNRKYLDFLDVLLQARDENGEGMSKTDIRAEVDTFLFEGHDTTASALSWTLYSLAKHPHFQEKCQAEIDAVFERKGSDELTWEDLDQFEFLTQCIKEAMRLHSPVPFIARQTSKPVDIDEYTIPTGTLISMAIYILHTNPVVWENPEEYRPERFSKDNIRDMNSFAYVPFSAGPRNCIGQHFAMNEEKAIMVSLLRRFTFEVDESHEIIKIAAAVMRAKNGIHLFVRERKPPRNTQK